MQREVSNPRWRLPNRKHLYLDLQTRKKRDFKGYAHVFVVKQSKRTTWDSARQKREWKIKDGGLLAASKLEVLISQLPDKIATLFQRLPQVFEAQQSKCDIPDIV